MAVSNRMDLTPLVTHEFTLEQLPEAFDLFSHQRAGVMKVAIYPGDVLSRRGTTRQMAEIEC
jgi:alcohol dehydrogenase